MGSVVPNLVLSVYILPEGTMFFFLTTSSCSTTYLTANRQSRQHRWQFIIHNGQSKCAAVAKSMLGSGHEQHCTTPTNTALVADVKCPSFHTQLADRILHFFKLLSLNAHLCTPKKKCAEVWNVEHYLKSFVLMCTCIGSILPQFLNDCRWITSSVCPQLLILCILKKQINL